MHNGFVAAVLFAGTAFAAPLSVAASLKCRPTQFTVTLSPENPTPYQVYGELCARGPVSDATLQVLVHGATYSHVYWDFPYKPELYSYVRALTRGGYATLNLDRIGIGQSSHPPPEEVDMAANAYVVHQVVQQMRAGKNVAGFGVVKSSKVMLVGHSLGTGVSILEQTTYRDVDGLILTGLLHSQGPGIAEAQAAFYPAQLDPKFAGQGLPPEYLTTQPGTRGNRFFYYAPFADPNVIAVDEATKETVTAAELNTLVPVLTETASIDVPVLVVVGDFDTLMCPLQGCTASGTLAQEPQYYPPEACAQFVAIPLAGHDINLHYQAPAWYLTARLWSDLYVGSRASAPPLANCP